MHQTTEQDPFAIDAWDQPQAQRHSVHLVDCAQWLQLTGEPAPDQPPSAADYTRAGLPWFDDAGQGAPIDGAPALAALDSVDTGATKRGQPLLAGDGALPRPVPQVSRRTARRRAASRSVPRREQDQREVDPPWPSTNP